MVRQSMIVENVWWRTLLTSWQPGSREREGEREKNGIKFPNSLQRHAPMT
jgi:hypothetical protein